MAALDLGLFLDHHFSESFAEFFFEFLSEFLSSKNAT